MAKNIRRYTFEQDSKRFFQQPGLFSIFERVYGWNDLYLFLISSDDGYIQTYYNKTMLHIKTLVQNQSDYEKRTDFDL